MTVQARDMVREVRVAIDMNRDDEPLIREGDTDTLTLDELIYARLVDAVRIVHTEAPHFLLESGHDFVADKSRDFFINSDGKGFIILPDDFLRLVAFRMSDWSRTVFEAISDTHPLYHVQSSKWKGLCGNPEKPVCAVVRRAEGKVLEFYSSRDDSAYVVQASYIPVPEIDEDGGIDVSQDCYRAAVYRAASLALTSLGDQLSTTMLEISRSLLQ